MLEFENYEDIKVIFSMEEDFKVELEQIDSTFSFDMGTNYDVLEYYEGTYSVVPKTEEQVLLTQNKFLKDDITVKKVPYYETSNDYGETVYIASEV